MCDEQTISTDSKIRNKMLICSQFRVVKWVGLCFLEEIIPITDGLWFYCSPRAFE